MPSTTPPIGHRLYAQETMGPEQQPQKFIRNGMRHPASGQKALLAFTTRNQRPPRRNFRCPETAKSQDSPRRTRRLGRQLGKSLKIRTCMRWPTIQQLNLNVGVPQYSQLDYSVLSWPCSRCAAAGASGRRLCGHGRARTLAARVFFACPGGFDARDAILLCPAAPPAHVEI